MVSRALGRPCGQGRVHTFACFDIAEARMVPQRSEADQARERAVAGSGGGARRAAGPLGARGGALGMGRGEGIEYASSAHGGARRGRPGVRVIGTLSCTKEP